MHLATLYRPARGTAAAALAVVCVLQSFVGGFVLVFVSHSARCARKQRLVAVLMCVFGGTKVLHVMRHGSSDRGPDDDLEFLFSRRPNP